MTFTFRNHFTRKVLPLSYEHASFIYLLLVTAEGYITPAGRPIEQILGEYSLCLPS